MSINHVPVLKAVLALGLLGTVCSASAATIEHWTQPDGARVLYVEARQNPIVDLRIDFDAGSRRDPADRPGMAGMTADMLSAGTTTLSEDAISNRFSDLASEFGAGVDRDRAFVHLRSLSSMTEREASVKLVNEILTRPAFPARVLTRLKAQAIAAYRQQQDSPEAVAYRLLNRSMYGTHPYASGARTDEAAISALTRADLQAFWRHYYRPSTMTISIVGDVDRTSAERLARQLTRGLSPAQAALPALPPVPAAQGYTIRKTHTATQASVMFGMPLITRDDPDYYALVVGNYILGGGSFDSRLMKELRDKRGLTYGASSWLAPYAQPGDFALSVNTRREQADEALKVARQTLADFVEHGPTEAEMAQAKGNIVGGFPLRYASNRSLIGYVAVIGFYNLPLSWLDDYPKAIDKVTAADVRDAYRRRVDPARMSVVVVGGEPQRVQ